MGVLVIEWKFRCTAWRDGREWDKKQRGVFIAFSLCHLQNHCHLLYHGYHLHHQHHHYQGEKRMGRKTERGFVCIREGFLFLILICTCSLRAGLEDKPGYQWSPVVRKYSLKTNNSLKTYQVPWSIPSLFRWAIIGHANLFLLKKIEDDRWKMARWSLNRWLVVPLFELLVVWMRCLRYLTDMGNLQNHVSRLNNRGEGESVAVNTLKIQVFIHSKTC